MSPQMKLRHYDCADCGIPCKSTSPNAERCAKLHQNRQSREYQQKMLARRRVARANRLPLRGEPQRRRQQRSAAEVTAAHSLIPWEACPPGFSSTLNRTQP